MVTELISLHITFYMNFVILKPTGDIVTVAILFDTNMTLLNADNFLDVIHATPLVSIDLIVTRGDSTALLGKRTNAPAKGFWFVPGGRILKDETIKNALARITLTETGLTTTDYTSQLTGVYEHFYNDNFFSEEGISTHYVVLAHHLTLSQAWQYHSDSQHTAMKWWAISDIKHTPEVHQNTQIYFKDWE